MRPGHACRTLDGMEISGISVVVFETARAVAIRAQVELAAACAQRSDALVSFATGATFGAFFSEIASDAGGLDLAGMHGTHLDEFLGFEPSTPGGFAHELLQCKPLARAPVLPTG